MFKSTICYFLSGMAISLLLFGFVGAFFVFPVLGSVSSIVIGMGFVGIHVASVLVLARHFFRINEVGLSLVTSLLTLFIMIQVTNHDGDWITGLWIFPLLIVNAIATIVLLFLLVILPKSHQKTCFNCTLPGSATITSEMETDTHHQILNNCPEIARDSSGWYALLQCRDCKAYLEAEYSRESGEVERVRALTENDARLKYRL